MTKTSSEISNIDYQQVIEYALEPLIIHSHLKIIYVNQAAERFFKASKKDIIGASPLDIFQESSKSAIHTRIQSAYERPADVIEETVYRMDGTTVEIELYCHPLWLNQTKAIQSYVRDITEKKAAEKKEIEMRNQVHELSSTLIPLLDGIAVLPLLGNIDQDRAKHLLDGVPAKVREQGIKCVIIDFSAIYNLDVLVAEYIFKISSVLSLLGVRSILTGLRPESAVVAVKLGIDFDSTPTVSTVEDALRLLGVK